jgi:anaerobic ribonucleoside-triphosphate reductase activating protein
MLALRPGIEGLTISGGEPFQQPEALLDLLARLDGSALGRLVFTGYTLEETRALPLGQSVLAHVDAIVAGRYVAAQRLARGLLGSANQTIHLLSDRYGLSDFAGVPGREAILHRDGSITLSGIDPWRQGAP